VRKRAFLLPLIGILFSGLVISAQDRPPIVIKPSLAEEVHVAAADFQPKNRQQATTELAAGLAALNAALWEDLKFAGWFSLENKSLYPVAPIAEPDQIKFSEWKSSPLAVDFLAIGNARIQGKEIVVEARLYDVKTQAQVVGRKYTATLDRIRSAAHSFADEIVYYLTAGASKGVSSTQIAFVSKRTGVKEIFVMDYEIGRAHV
jgi:TolB protein